MNVTVTGVERVLRAIGKARTADAINIADGLAICAQVILRKASQYVPVETGALKASGRVEGNTRAGLASRFMVVYGGPEAPYALYVHENLEAKHAPPTQAKWLERATREVRGTCASILRRVMGAERVKVIDGQRFDITAGNLGYD